MAYRDLGDSVRSARQLELYEQDKLGGPRANDPLMAVVNSLKTGAPDELKRGIEFEKQGRLEEAIAAHEKAVELDPDFEQAHVNLVILYGRQGNVAKAEEHYKAAIEANPDQADLHYNFGVLAFQAGRMKEAERAFKLALDLNPSYPQAHNNMGQMLERQGRIDEAIAHYRKAIENRPDYRLAHFHLGRMLIAKGRGREAIAEFEKTLEPVDEETPQYMYGLAAAHARVGDRRKAVEFGEKSRLLAERFNQPQLAATIAEDMKKLRR
jgi:superkiller protein 3